MMLRLAKPDDVATVARIALAAYAIYVPRMGREPAPMVADFAAVQEALVTNSDLRTDR